MIRFLSRMPLAGKVFPACISVAFGISLVGSLAMYKDARESLRNEVQDRLCSIAATAAWNINPELFSVVRTRSDESLDDYQYIKNSLLAIRLANSDIRNIYTLRKDKKTKTWHIVVGSLTDQEIETHIGDQFDRNVSRKIEEAKFAPTADNEPHTDRYGTWLSGYAPILDDTGTLQAIV